MDSLTFHLMVNHVPLLGGVLGTLFVLLATVIRSRRSGVSGRQRLRWQRCRTIPSNGLATEPPVVPAWLRGAVVVPALASTAATVRTVYLAGFIAHRTPLLMRARVPPADAIPAHPAFGPRPPE